MYVFIHVAYSKDTTVVGVTSTTDEDQCENESEFFLIIQMLLLLFIFPQRACAGVILLSRSVHVCLLNLPLAFISNCYATTS